MTSRRQVDEHERRTFRTECPKGHDVWQTFSIAQIQAHGDALEFWCPECGTLWRPTTAQQAELLYELRHTDEW